MFLMTALRQLTDAGVSPKTRAVLLDALLPLLPPPSSHGHSAVTQPRPSMDALLRVSDLRAMRTGANMFVDLTAHVPADLRVADAAALEEHIREALVAVRKDVKEVRVRFHPVSKDDQPGPEHVR